MFPTDVVILGGARTGFRLGEGKLEDSLMTALLDSYCGIAGGQGIAMIVEAVS